jgi:hypothetical protein
MTSASEERNSALRFDGAACTSAGTHRMTPHEKAVAALNRRLERLQANLGTAESDTARRFLFQSIVVTLGIADALNDYIKRVGEYAKRRHSEIKQANETLAARHAALLQGGKELLEKLKANPTDRVLRKEIERAQNDMEGIQKSLRRGANSLQRDVAPSVAMIDQLAESVRRLCEAEENEALKRTVKAIVEQVKELYADQPDLPAKGVIQAEAWTEVAVTEIEQAAGFHDAYARAGYQATLALELVALAVVEVPPATTE